MTITSQQYAGLTKDSYESHKLGYQPTGQREKVSLNGVIFEVVEYVDNRQTGYQGTIYQRMDTLEMVVAHRGTEFDRQALLDGAVADGGMLLARSNLQAADAIALTRRALGYANEKGKNSGHAPDVTVTGHSLGGCLAQITAHYFDLQGETFNAYGAASLNRHIPPGGHNVINHMMATDPVSAASAHFGQTRLYAMPDEIQALRTAGYTANTRLPQLTANPLMAVGLSLDAHSLDRFLDVDDKGQPDLSVLRGAKALQLAQEYDPVIDRYRADVQLLRTTLTMAPQIAARLVLPVAVPAWELAEGGTVPAGEPARREHAPLEPLQARFPQTHGQLSAQQIERSARELIGEPPQRPAPPASGNATAPGQAAQPSKPAANRPLSRDQIDAFRDAMGDASGAAGPNKPPLTLENDPIGFLDKMLAAAKAGDHATFRQMTQQAADGEAGRALRAEAIAAVDRQEQLAMQQAWQARQQEQAQPTPGRQAPHLSM